MSTLTFLPGARSGETHDLRISRELRQFHLKGKHNQKTHGGDAAHVPDVTDTVKTKSGGVQGVATDYQNYGGSDWLKLDVASKKKWHKADDLEVVSKGVGIGGGAPTTEKTTPKTIPAHGTTLSKETYEKIHKSPSMTEAEVMKEGTLGWLNAWNGTLPTYQKTMMDEVDQEMADLVGSWQKGGDSKLRSASKKILQAKGEDPGARRLMREVAASPPSHTSLYRGMGVNESVDEIRKRYSVGSTFDEPVTSFSERQSVSQNFMFDSVHHRGQKAAIEFELEPGAHAVPIWAMSGMRELKQGKKPNNDRASEFEHLSGGRFQIVRVEELSNESLRDRMLASTNVPKVRVVIRQVGVWDA